MAADFLSDSDASGNFYYCDSSNLKQLHIFDEDRSRRLAKESVISSDTLSLVLLQSCTSTARLTSVSSWKRRRKQAASLPSHFRSLHVASLSMPRGIGSIAARENQRSLTSQWSNFLAVVGVQGRVLMKEVPLFERAGIGAIAGGLAGGFTNATLHPIDTVKTKLQTRGSSSLYKGPIDVVRKVLAKQGVAGFYCGLPAALLGSMISSSVYFGMYELGKGLLSSFQNCPAALVPPIAAALGNITSSAILVPKEVIKQRMQAGATGTAMQVMMGTLRAEGIGGMYAGYSAALLRNLPSNMLNFSAFEYMKAAWLSRTGKDTLTPWQSVLSGALAGTISAAFTTPLDVVKTRLMTQARLAVAAAGASGTKAEAAARAQAIAAYTYTGVAATLQKIWLEEGARGLTRGMAPRLIYSACFSAVGFLSFETFRVFLLKQHFKKQGRLHLVGDVKPLEAERGSKEVHNSGASSSAAGGKGDSNHVQVDGGSGVRTMTCHT